MTKASTQNHDSGEILDLVVIGGGPHALALLCRLLEQSPFSTMSDQDHQRYHHIRVSKSKPQSGRDIVRRCSPLLDVDRLKIKVIDANAKDGWIKAQCFFILTHALRTFAKDESRECELQDITACFDIGCRNCKKKKQRSHFIPNDRHQFFTPSASLFADFCSSLVDRYNLLEVLIEGIVTTIIPRLDRATGSKYFIIKSFNKTSGSIETFSAKRVVAALGNANHARLPPWVHTIEKTHVPEKRIIHALEFIECLKQGVDHCVSECSGHNDIVGKDLAELMAREEGEDVKLLVVGGGLTSAQLVSLAGNRGIKKVTLITRSKLKTSQFDLSLDWIGRNSNIQFAKFWSEPLETRLAILRRAKNGGSVTPEYMKLLMQYQTDGWLKVKENLQVRQANWGQSSPLGRPCWRVEFDDGKSRYFDVIWLGTGSVLDVTKEPCLSKVLEKAPIQVVGGLPALNEDLRWGDLELYMMSSYCGLSLGPTAGNLIGGRVTADRIASNLWSKWIKENHELRGLSALKNAEKHKPDLSSLATMTGSFENFWSVLVESE
ncbi:UNVERIFIED_CONTAM: hypothetical protein HDU68_001898 [Siphonaria sp. JEL0065]|nr:hypothetical protein HDU68_001898 [Siphonaria sp. JEL0065]